MQGFPNSIKGWGMSSPVGEMENFVAVFLLGVGNLRRSEFNDFYIFKS